MEEIEATEQQVTQARLRVEQAGRSLESGIELRPVFHWAQHRIHAHVAITMLALLLVNA